MKMEGGQPVSFDCGLRSCGIENNSRDEKSSTAVAGQGEISEELVYPLLDTKKLTKSQGYESGTPYISIPDWPKEPQTLGKYIFARFIFATTFDSTLLIPLSLSSPCCRSG
jgi:hypothetical protein